MDFPLFADKDSTRYCHLRLRVLEDLLKDDRVIDALIDQLEVPGKASTRKTLSRSDKIAAIDAQVEHFRRTKTSQWRDTSAGEVLAASIWRARRLADRIVLQAFSAVKKESDLLAPIARWLGAQRATPYAEVPLGTKRIDVLGHRKGNLLFAERFIGVELKNDLREFDRALNQLATYSEYCHRTYLACTPALAAEYLDKHASAHNVAHWDAGVFTRKLEHFGFGLLLVEGDTVYEPLEPKVREQIPSAQLQDLRNSLARSHTVDL